MNEQISPKDNSQIRLCSFLNYKTALILGLFILLGMVFATLDLYPKLSHMNLNVLSGPQSSSAYRLVQQLSEKASKRYGKLNNEATQGVAANLKRLMQAGVEQKTLFAVVPDGLHFDQPDKLELIARLPAINTVFFLSRDITDINNLQELQGARIGIGLQGSATALLSREMFGRKNTTALNLRFQEGIAKQQIKQLIDGELDFVVSITAKNDPLMVNALRSGLEIVNFSNADAWASHFKVLQEATLYAGQFDQVELLPKTNINVFQVDTLVLGNRTATRSDSVALLVLLDDNFHQFIDYNKRTLHETELPVAQDLRTFVKNGGPNFLDEYLPGLVNFMPPANLLHYIVVVSLLMNMTSGWNRLRLFLVDYSREKIDNKVQQLFGTKLTLDNFNNSEMADHNRLTESDIEQLNELINESENLLNRCNKYAGSFVTPLGHENVYRYHEGLIKEQLEMLKRVQIK